MHTCMVSYGGSLAGTIVWCHNEFNYGLYQRSTLVLACLSTGRRVLSAGLKHLHNKANVLVLKSFVKLRVLTKHFFLSTKNI